MKLFIRSYLLLLKQQTRKCKRKCIVHQFWNILADYFWDIGSKVGSFVKHPLWQQNYFGMDYLSPPPPIFRSTPQLICNMDYLPPPIIQYFEISIPPPPICNWGGDSNYEESLKAILSQNSFFTYISGSGCLYYCYFAFFIWNLKFKWGQFRKILIGLV